MKRKRKRKRKRKKRKLGRRVHLRRALPAVLFVFLVSTGFQIEGCTEEEVGATSGSGDTDTACVASNLIDQNVFSTTFQTSRTSAQSIQLNRAIRLTSFELYIYGVGNSVDITIEVRQGNGSNPSNGSLLASINETVSTANSLKVFEFPTQPTLQASTTYWVIVQTSGTTNIRQDSSDNGYQNGTVWVDHPRLGWWDWDADFVFRINGCET